MAQRRVDDEVFVASSRTGRNRKTRATSESSARQVTNEGHALTWIHRFRVPKSSSPRELTTNSSVEQRHPPTQAEDESKMDVSAFEDPPDGGEATISETVTQLENDLELPIAAILAIAYYVFKLAVIVATLCLCVLLYCFVLGWLCLFWMQTRLFMTTAAVLETSMSEQTQKSNKKPSQVPSKRITTSGPHSPTQQDPSEAYRPTKLETNPNEVDEQSESITDSLGGEDTGSMAVHPGTLEDQRSPQLYDEHGIPSKGKGNMGPEKANPTALHVHFEDSPEHEDTSYGEAKKVRMSSYGSPAVVYMPGSHRQGRQQPKSTQEQKKKSKEEKKAEAQTEWLAKLRSDPEEAASRPKHRQKVVLKHPLPKTSTFIGAPPPNFSADQLESAKSFMTTATRANERGRHTKASSAKVSKQVSQSKPQSLVQAQDEHQESDSIITVFEGRMPPHLRKLQSIQAEKDSQSGGLSGKLPAGIQLPRETAKSTTFDFEAPKHVTNPFRDEDHPPAKENERRDSLFKPVSSIEQDSDQSSESEINVAPSSGPIRIIAADALKSMNTSQAREDLQPDANAFQCSQCHNWTPQQKTSEQHGLCIPCESVRDRIGDAKRIIEGGNEAGIENAHDTIDSFQMIWTAMQSLPGAPGVEAAQSMPRVESDDLLLSYDEGYPATSAQHDTVKEASGAAIAAEPSRKQQKRIARAALKEAWCDREDARRQVMGGHTKERAQELREATAEYNKKRSDLASLMITGQLNEGDARVYPLFGAADLTAPKYRPVTVEQLMSRKKSLKEAASTGDSEGSRTGDEASDQAEQVIDSGEPEKHVNPEALKTMKDAKQLRAEALEYFKQPQSKTGARYQEWKAKGDANLDRATKYYKGKREALRDAMGGELTLQLEAEFPPV